MTSSAQTPERAATVPEGSLAYLASWKLVWVLTIAFVLVGLEGILSGRYLHDESLLTYYGARALGRAPIPVFFFQKIRPVVALIYAPIAPLGYDAFAVVHLLAGASVIPMVAAIGRELGQRTFVIPAVVVASSTLMSITASSGHSNSDAAAILTLGFYLLLVRRRGFASGVVLGAGILMRSEVAPFLIVIAIAWLLERDVRPLLGMAVVPLAYTVLGTAYHRDLLWVLHFPPTLMAPNPHSDWYTRPDSLVALGDWLRDMVSLSPMWGLLLLVRPRALNRAEATLAIGVLVFLGLIRGLPMLGLFNFDASPRYMLVTLPGLAIVLGRWADDALDGRDGGPVAIAVLFGLLLLGHHVLGRVPGDLSLLVIAMWALAIGLARLRRPALAVWLVVATTALSYPLWIERTQLQRRLESLEAVSSWWRASGPGPDDEVTVLTNVSLARAWLEHAGLLDRPERIHLLLRPDTAYELRALTNREVGQFRALIDVLDRDFYGQLVLDPGDPDDWAEGTIVILQTDARLAEGIDLPRWLERIEIEATYDLDNEADLLIGRLTRAPAKERP